MSILFLTFSIDIILSTKYMNTSRVHTHNSQKNPRNIELIKKRRDYYCIEIEKVLRSRYGSELPANDAFYKIIPAVLSKLDQIFSFDIDGIE